MPPLSIKAVLIANAVQLAVFFAICVAAALATLAVAWGLAGFPADIKPITGGLKASSLFMSLLGTISVMPSSLSGGYVAGRLAGHRPALHGALSSIAWFVLLILIVLTGPPSQEPPDAGPHGGSPMPVVLSTMLFLCGPPLLGALGGLLARRAERPRQGRESRVGSVIRMGRLSHDP